MNSRDKGKRAELEAAALLRDHGFAARRGQQFSGGPESPDVVSRDELDPTREIGFHLEIKHVERLDLEAACEQARTEAPEGVPWAVLHRRNRTKWKVTLDAERFLQLVHSARRGE